MTKHAENAEAPSLAQVEEWNTRLEASEHRIREAESRERKLVEELAGLRADGAGGSEEAETLRAERTELGAELDELRATAPVLRERIQAGTESAYRAEAEKRIQAIKRVVGGLSGEQPQRIKRLAERADAFLAELDSVNSAYSRQQGLLSEAAALAERFGLALPELKVFLAPQHDADITATLAQVRNGAFPARSHHAKPKPPRESPGREIIDLAGPTPQERKAAEAEAEKKREQEERDRRALERFQPELLRAEAHRAARNFEPTSRTG